MSSPCFPSLRPAIDPGPSFISREPERPDRNGFWHKTAAGWRCSQPAEIGGDHNSLTQKMLALNSDGLMLHTLRGG
jgi:hypothetical protein